MVGRNNLNFQNNKCLLSDDYMTFWLIMQQNLMVRSFIGCLYCLYMYIYQTRDHVMLLDAYTHYALSKENIARNGRRKTRK